MKFAVLFLLFLNACLCEPASGQSGLRSPSFVANLNPPSAGGSAPDAPTNIGIDYASDAPNFGISWTPTGALGDGYELATSTDAGGFVITGGIDPGAEYYVHSGAIADGHVYIYKVRATNAFGASAFSASITNDIFYDAVYYNRAEEAAGNSRAAVIDTIGFGSLTEQGGTVTQTTGRNNNGAAFTSIAGRSFKSASQSGNTVFGADFTISLWIYVTALPSIIDTTIIIREVSSDVNLNLTAAGNLVFKSTSGAAGATMVLGSLNAWHFIVIKMDSGAGLDYISVDGGTFASAAWDGPPASDDYLYICPPFDGLLSLDGRCDEICIAPHTWSQAEVTSVYGGGTAPRFK